jgi:hypothetical protein
MAEAATGAYRRSIRLMNGAVMKENLVISESKSGEKISEEAIRETLSRILESAMFIQSDRLSRFLRFTVETTLAGDADMLKEYVIGTEVYDRKPPYHPSVDSIVRSEARRLRNKLRQYYESVGKDDPIFINYRIGSYVPAFRPQRTEDRSHLATHRAFRELLTEGLFTQAVDLSSVARKLDVQIVFEGTVRVLRSGAASSTPKNFRSGQTPSKGNQIRKVISMSLKKSAEGRLSPASQRRTSPLRGCSVCLSPR